MNPREPDTGDRGLRELVMAGAARLEPEEPRVEPKRGSWRARKRPWEGAAYENEK